MKSREQSRPVDAAREWKALATRLVLGLLLFLSLSGLSIFFLPFSIFQQTVLLIHVLVGVLLLPLIVTYVIGHARKRSSGNLSHYMLLGYLSAVALLIITVSGLIEVIQVVFGTKLSRFWDQVHLVAGFALIVFLLAHLLTLIIRKSGGQEIKRAYWTSLTHAGVIGIALMLLGGVFAKLYPQPEFDQALPDAYNFQYGMDRPFAPSLSRKDMTDAEDELKTRIVNLLPTAQAALFSANLKIDPSKHEGIVSAAERLINEMGLDPSTQEEVAHILDDTRERFRTEGRIDPRLLSGSQSCGTAGCHDEILEEWEPSAHRYSSMDIVFQRVQEIMTAEKDPQSTRYCAGCHDPISLFAGAKNEQNITLSSLGADEGISCIACHAISQTDVRGNADYTIDTPAPYLFEYHEGPVAKKISDILIRAYPRHHVESYARPLYKTTEFCAACHKQYLDEEINDFGWVQGQNQYDSWRKSRWHDENDPENTLSCRECHMPLIDSSDPASGDFSDTVRSPTDGKHRSHRFLGANQFIPLYHNLPGAEEQVRQIVEWLRGDYAIPEIAHKWTEGPVVRLALGVPEEVKPGEEIEIHTHLTNNKTGHDFPTGPLDMIEAWIELTVSDEAGNVVFRSGTLDERGYLENPQIVFKKELIDREGEPVDRHNLWDAVASRYQRSLFPGFTDTTQFSFKCPAMHQADGESTEGSIPKEQHSISVPEQMSGTTLTVKATLWYSKFKAPFMDKVFGAEANMRAPATAITEATETIRIISQ